MTRITITENGREKIVTDLTQYRQERETILVTLAAIYANFEKGPVDALASREPEIVDLVNRFNEIEHIIEMFESAEVRRANILAGFEVVKLNRRTSP